MFIIDTRRLTVVFDPKGKKPAEPAICTYYVDTEKDITPMASTEQVEVFNTIARGIPDLGLREVNRFASREKAQVRLWGALLRLRELQLEKEREAKTIEAKRVEPPKKAPATEAKSPAPAATPGVRPIRDKEKPIASKVYPIRPGTMQEIAFKLLDTPDGMDVDEFIAKMNSYKREKWTRSNAWSSLVYIFHTLKGYGLRCRDGRFYVLKPKSMSKAA